MVKFNSKTRENKKIRSLKKKNIQHGGLTEQEIKQEIDVIQQKTKLLRAQMDTIQRDLDNLVRQESILYDKLHIIKRTVEQEEGKRSNELIDEKWSQLRIELEKMVLLPENVLSSDLIVIRDDLIQRINVIDNKINEELKSSITNLPKLDLEKEKLETEMRERMTAPEFLLYLHNNITSQLNSLKEVSKSLNDWGLSSCMSGPQSSCSWIDYLEREVKTRRQTLEQKKKSMITDFFCNEDEAYSKFLACGIQG
jgi:hypothetical protein